MQFNADIKLKNIRGLSTYQYLFDYEVNITINNNSIKNELDSTVIWESVTCCLFPVAAWSLYASLTKCFTGNVYGCNVWCAHSSQTLSLLRSIFIGSGVHVFHYHCRGN